MKSAKPELRASVFSDYTYALTMIFKPKFVFGDQKDALFNPVLAKAGVRS